MPIAICPAPDRITLQSGGGYHGPIGRSVAYFTAARTSKSTVFFRSAKWRYWPWTC